MNLRRIIERDMMLKFVQISVLGGGLVLSGAKLVAVGEDYLRLRLTDDAYTYVNLAHIVSIKIVGKPTHWKESA